MLVIGSGTIVVLFGAFLLALAGTIFVHPSLASSFLRKFASSPFTHYTEQSLRLLTGLAILHFSPHMWFSRIHFVFGGILAMSSTVLMLLPWQWHNTFGKKVIPIAIKYLSCYGIGALGLGVAILGCWSRAIFD